MVCGPIQGSDWWVICMTLIQQLLAAFGISQTTRQSPVPHQLFIRKLPSISCPTDFLNMEIGFYDEKEMMESVSNTVSSNTTDWVSANHGYCIHSNATTFWCSVASDDTGGRTPGGKAKWRPPQRWSILHIVFSFLKILTDWDVFYRVNYECSDSIATIEGEEKKTRVRTSQLPHRTSTDNAQ